MTLTDAQMLGHWRRHRGLEDARADCSIELFEGMDINTALRVEMRQWYLNLLDTAPLRYLQLTDISSRLTFTPTATAGVWTAALPVDVRRLITLTLEGAAPADVEEANPTGRRAVLNSNPYVRACRHRPTVTVSADRTVTVVCNTLHLPPVIAAMAVVDPGDELYTFDESALSLITKTEQYGL